MSVVWAHVSLWEHATDLVWWSYYSHLWIGRTKRSGKLRGICVSSYLGKLFCSILNQRLLEYIVSLNILHKSQIGILPSNRTADHVFALRTLRDKYVHNHNEKIFACFVDFKKVFDSVWRDGLLNMLLQIDVGGSFYNLIKSLYHNSSCSIKIAPKQTRSFRYARGVGQGCILRPLPFNLYINDLPFAFENTLSDFFVKPNGAKLNSLLYSDDYKTGLQNCLGKLSSFCTSYENQSQENKHCGFQKRAKKNCWFSISHR